MGAPEAVRGPGGSRSADEAGDIVYAIIGGKVVPMEIQYIYVNRNGRLRYHAAEAVFEKNFREPAFGRDVFLSQEAAENRLEVGNGAAQD